MTALKKYEKLEAAGLWRETPGSQKREVYVNFGDTSLVIRNQKNDILSHWSLPAVERTNPGNTPAIYAPNVDASETLEIEDSTMISAIEEVQAAIDRRRPHPGRLRIGILFAFSAVIAGLALLWLPGALERHVVRVVPFETRNQIGNRILSHITRLTGQACNTAQGARALNTLKQRLSTSSGGDIIVLKGGISKSAHLPGGLILLNKTLIEDYETPDVAAGFILVEQQIALESDPLTNLLQFSGGIESFRLLTTGAIKDAALRGYARHILTQSLQLPNNDVLISRFLGAGFPSSPMGYAIDITGETTLTLIEADPFRHKQYRPLLGDSDWVGLQGICGS